ncbi:MAG: NAD(P)H-dependent glycerol-3-phosphate dehydrogenase [Rhodothermales bacterium]
MVAVIGAGSWGTALAISLAAAGHAVRIWARRPELAEEMTDTRRNRFYLRDARLPDSIVVSADAERVVAGADVWVFAVPSQSQRSVAARFAPWAGDVREVVSVAKGIENDTLLLSTQVLEQALPDVPPDRIGVLYGPSHAEEVAQGLPAAVVASAASLETARAIQRLFMTRSLRVYVNTDVIGVQIAGSAKNVMAIAAGISDGVGYGDNAKAALVTRGIAEMRRLGQAMGAAMSTFSGLAGIGDLVVTCMSGLSRNRYVGEQIGEGRGLKDIEADMQMVAEGVRTTESVVALARRHGIEMPICESVHAILFEGKKPQEAVNALMTRSAKHEEWLGLDDESAMEPDA